MSYTAPALSNPVALTGSYTAPALSIPVVLGESAAVTGALAASLPAVSVPAPTWAATGESVANTPMTLAATVPPVRLALTVSALGMMRQGTRPYAPPPLMEPVVLAPGYTPPSLTAPVILGLPANHGQLAATLPPASLPVLTLVAAGARDRHWLYASLPAPSFTLRFLARERPITATLSATLPAPGLAPITFAAAGAVFYAATLGALLPIPGRSLFRLAGHGTQPMDLMDADGRRVRSPVRAFQVGVSGVAVRQTGMLPVRQGRAVRQTLAAPLPFGAALRQTDSVTLQRAIVAMTTHGLSVLHGAGLWSAEALRQHRFLTEWAATGLPTRRGVGLPAAETQRLQVGRALAEGVALPVWKPLNLGQHTAQRTATRLRLYWTAAEDPPPGRWWPFYIVPWLTAVLNTGYRPRPLYCRVVLSWRWIAQPYCAGFDPTIPIQEIYQVINTFSLVRADTGQPVEALEFSASLDADSWGWSWSATVPTRQMSRVRSPQLGEFVELIATLNGTALRLVVERLTRTRQFGASSLKISGRGRAAWLSEPHAPIITVLNTEARTAQQLLNDALTVNGVPLGWMVDWQLNDWSVPAGLWSYTGTYIGAACRLAESGGGYVQADAALQTLHVLPYYPVAPWAWAAEIPDLVLPEAVCVTEDIEWQDKPAYNAVWVVGHDQGRRDLIKRAGTAGDCLAPSIADPLATHETMTRQRGLRAIADTGRQVHLSMQLPILAETGIIQPGQLVEYVEQGVPHRGLSRAVSVRYQFPTASQTIKVETHELESV